MANSDWLYEVGVDTAAADSKLLDFVHKSTATLKTLPSVKITVDSMDAVASVNRVMQQMKTTIAKAPVVQIQANNTQALQSVNQVKQALQGIRGTAAGAFTGMTSGALSAAGATRSVRSAVESNTQALDFMNKAWTYSLLKLAEYEVIAKSVEGVVHELTDSVKQAADVQFEQTLQKLYSPQVFNSIEKQNEALNSATIIAKQWGSDIRDVLQVQGLWTKQTNDLASAQYLAAKAEEMHRASGIETLEVYRTTVALASQMGTSLSTIPGLYDQIAYAAVKMAVPLNNLSGKGKMESMKEVFEGMAGSTAILKSLGMISDKDASVGIATISTAIQTMGKDANKVSSDLNTMFASLEGKGVQRQNFFDILNAGHTGTINSPEEMVSRMIEKKKEILAAAAHGDLGVRPQQLETLTSYLGILGQVLKTSAQIRSQSTGMLDTIAGAQMQLLQGQTDRLKASIQQFTIALGQQLVPSALDVIRALQQLFPVMAQNASGIASTGKELFALGEAMIVWQLMQKGISGVTTELTTLASAQTVEARQAAIGISNGYGTVASVTAAKNAMLAQQKVIQDLASQEEILAWRTTGLQTAVEGLNGKYTALNMTANTVADIAETRVVPSLNLVGTAAWNAVGNLSRMLGPLALIQVAMATFSTMGSTDQRLDAAAEATKARIKGASVSGGMTALGNAWNHGFAALDPKNGQDLDKALSYALKYPETHAAAVHAINRLRRDQQGEAGPALTESYEGGSQVVTQGGGILGSQGHLVRRASSRGVDEAKIDSDVDRVLQVARMGQTRHELIVNGYGQYSKPPKGGVKGQPPGGGAEPLPDEGAKKKDNQAATQEAINLHAIEKTKGDAQAAMVSANDTAEARKLDIETLKKQGEMTGWNANMVLQLVAAYRSEEAALTLKRDAAKMELPALKGEIDIAQKLYASTKEGTKEHEAAGISLRSAEEAYKKATGAVDLYTSAIKRARVEEAYDKRNAQINIDLASGGGLAGYRSRGKEILASVEEARKSGGLSAEAVTANAGMVELQRRQAELLVERAKHPGDKDIVADLKATDDAIKQLSADIAKIPGDFKKVGDAAQGIGLSAMSKNGEDAASIMGVDKKSLQAVTDYLTQVRQITEERAKLKDEEDQLGTGPEADRARQQVEWARQQLDIQQQMLPLVEQQKMLEDQIATIRKSAAYTSLDKSLQKEGNTLLDQMLTRDFKDSTRPTFGTKYGGRPTKSGGVLSGLIQDYTQTSGADAIKSVSGHLLDGIFPVDKLKAQEETNRAELKTIYTDAVSGMLLAAQGILDGSENMLKATGNAPGSSDATGTGFKYGPPSPSHSGATGTGFEYGPPAALAAGGTISVLAQIALHTKATAGNTDVNGSPTGLASNLVAKLDASDKTNPMFGSAKGGFFGAAKSGKGGQNFTAGNIMAGMGEGSAMSAMFGTSGPMGEILGGVGGAFGPVGAAIGSIIGGMIGPHLNATNNPDMVGNTGAYGTFLANFQGVQSMVNGNPMDPTKQFNSYLGYQSQASQMASFINSPQMIQELPPALQNFAASLKGLEGPNGSLALNAQNPESQGQFHFASGKSAAVTDVMNWVNELQTYRDQMQGLPIAPLISMNAYGGNGMNPGGAGGASTIGLTAAEVQALQLTAYGTKLNPQQSGPIGYASTQYQGSPYATPGIGTSTIPGTTASQPLYTTPANNSPLQMQTINLVVDSKVLASVVTAQQSNTANAAGLIPA